MMPDTPPRRSRRVPDDRANNLDGRTWTRYSISVWSDVTRNAEEKRLGHPALFPEALPARLIECFTASEAQLVLDPFAGTGSTLLAAARLGRRAVGFEICPEYFRIAEERARALLPLGPKPVLYHADARRISQMLPAESVDLVVTSPPYWDVLSGARTADRRAPRDYAGAEGDLARIREYPVFLEALGAIFEGVLAVMRPGAYCCAVVMDLRKGKRFFPFHCDLSRELVCRGFEWDDIIIWDRHADYSSLRPLGFPSVFRVNKVHEYILIFRKPRS